MRFHDDNIPKQVRELAVRVTEELETALLVIYSIRDHYIDETDRETEFVCRKYGIDFKTHGLVSNDIVSSVMDGKEIEAQYDMLNAMWAVRREPDAGRKQKYFSFLGELVELQDRITEAITIEAEELQGFAYSDTHFGPFCACISMEYKGRNISGVLVIPTRKLKKCYFITEWR